MQELSARPVGNTQGTELKSALVPDDLKSDKKGLPFKVKSIKQTTTMDLLVDILMKAKSLSIKPKCDDNIFNVDDLLVEMAVLKTYKKLSEDYIFYFKVKFDKLRWQ